MVIKWSDFAKENMHDLVRFSKMEAPKEYINELVKNVATLKRFPEAGKELFSIDGFEVRQLIFKMHRIIYRIEDNDVHIGAVIHVFGDTCFWGCFWGHMFLGTPTKNMYK